jgi:hypothetical protein
MKKFLVISILAMTLSAPMMLAAEEEKAADTYIYATYFYCKTSLQEKADEIMKAHNAPVWDAAVADGTVSGWGWVAHHTGGKWRRIQYHTSGTITGLLAAQESVGKKIDEAGGDPDNEFGKICGAHDDYIWKQEAGNSTQSTRGTAAISVYHICNMAKEERADEIVKKVFAPIYDKAVADGKITSWGWNSHQIGGEYRRLGTMTAADYPSLLKARDEIFAAMYPEGEENAEANEFDTICTSHSDYLWDIQHEKN